MASGTGAEIKNSREQSVVGHKFGHFQGRKKPAARELIVADGLLSACVERFRFA
ncbi:hypothetical protein [Bradyrhizobium sp. RDM4]|uniref:hypothetical protein n=1 Tax=Bradyrhizobium sp. RDM4 TaxID=3378765 RepID=UPI0038FBE7E3